MLLREIRDNISSYFPSNLSGTTSIRVTHACIVISAIITEVYLVGSAIQSPNRRSLVIFHLNPGGGQSLWSARSSITESSRFRIPPSTPQQFRFYIDQITPMDRLNKVHLFLKCQKYRRLKSAFYQMALPRVAIPALR